MSEDNRRGRVSGDQVKCHECSSIWPRQQGGLQCPSCNSEFVQLISDSTPPSPELRPLSASPSPDQASPGDIDGQSRTALESMSQHHPWPHAVESGPADRAASFPFGNWPPSPRNRPPGRGSSRSYRWASNTSNGNSTMTFSALVTHAGRVGGPSSTQGETHGLVDETNRTIADLEGEFQRVLQSPSAGGEQRHRLHRSNPTGPFSPAMPGAFPDTPRRDRSASGSQVAAERSSPSPGRSRHVHPGQDHHHHRHHDRHPRPQPVPLFLQGEQPLPQAIRGPAEAMVTLLRQHMSTRPTPLPRHHPQHDELAVTEEAIEHFMSLLAEPLQGLQIPGAADPASIRALPRRPVSHAMLDENGKAECSICMENVDVGEMVTSMPCTHWFHEACIAAWLLEHDTCPHCRKGISDPVPSS